MAILIDLGLPKQADEMIELAVFGDGSVVKTGESWRSPEDGKCYYCPSGDMNAYKAFEISEPHGRLIDADAALKNIKPIKPEDRRRGCTLETTKRLMMSLIDRAPTIIPASESKERPAFLPQYELTPRSEEG